MKFCCSDLDFGSDSHHSSIFFFSFHNSFLFFIRDFSTANLVGAKGLLGRSWPDLDMLPLGWLTDAGQDSTFHFSTIS